MENLDLLSNDLEVSPLAQSYLTEAARWGSFWQLWDLYFVQLRSYYLFLCRFLLHNCHLIILCLSNYSAAMKVTMTVVYLLLALLFFFPCFYLYKFSVKMQSAVKGMSQENFDESLMNLKSLFKFYGIFTIVIFSFYALVFIIGIIAAAMH